MLSNLPFGRIVGDRTRHTSLTVVLCTILCWMLGFDSGTSLAASRGGDPEIFVPGQILVKFRDDLSPLDVRARVDALELSPLSPLRVRDDRVRFIRTGTIPGKSLGESIAMLRADPTVAWAEPNGLCQASAPNDPECIDDSNPEGNSLWDQWGYYRVQEDQAYDGRPGGPDLHLVRVAVLDSGVDFDHPDGPSSVCMGGGCFWANGPEQWGEPGVDDDLNGYVDDILGLDLVRTEQGQGDVAGYDGDPDVYATDTDGSCGDSIDNDGDGSRDEGVYHGTHLAGILAAQTNNDFMFAGHTWSAETMVVRVLSPEGWGTWADIAEGIEYAADNGAHVINLSLGGSSHSQILEDAVVYAHGLGCILVAAAGNDGQSSIDYPARYVQTIAVAASNPDNGRASFSNGSSDVDVAAPGVRIFANAVVSSWASAQGDGPVGTGTYYWANGTSQATPMVAALACNLRSIYGVDFDNEAVRCQIKSTATDLSGTWDGAGLIDASVATTLIDMGACCLPDGACAAMSEICCGDLGGVYGGVESECGNVDCETTDVESRVSVGESRGIETVLPNPSRGVTHVTYSLGSPTAVELGVFDVRGRLVRALVSREQPAGVHSAAWDGTNGQRAVPGGVYFIRLIAGETVTSRTVVLRR